MLSNDIEGSLNVRDQNMPIFNLNPEFPLNGLMHMHTSFNINEASLISPMGVKGNGYALIKPTLTFHLSGSIWLSLLWTHLMMRFAVRPGCVWSGLRGDGFSCAWVVGCMSILARKLGSWLLVRQGD